MRYLKRIWCWIVGHRWRTGIYPHEWIHTCRRCGKVWTIHVRDPRE